MGKSTHGQGDKQHLTCRYEFGNNGLVNETTEFIVFRVAVGNAGPKPARTGAIAIPGAAFGFRTTVKSAPVNFESFASVAAYNAAYPDCPIPTEPQIRNGLRGYHAAMNGIVDDMTGMDASLTVDFLPDGAPEPDEPDRIGTVVATCWGEGPVLVLAPQISLRAAWQTIRGRWPTRLSQIRQALIEVAHTPLLEQSTPTGCCSGTS